MHRLAIHLLGPPQVTIEGLPATELRSEKALALLAYLAVESDRAHRREKLAGMLWPDYAERSARANLRRALADLRRALGERAPSADAPPPYLQATRQTIQFDTSNDAWVDVTAFCTLLKPPLSSETPPSQLERAVKLYRGAFLEGFSVAVAQPLRSGRS